MIDSRRLRALLEIARTGSLAAAADVLGYTPSAVSQQVHALERELQVTLLDRRGRGVTLTEPGAALARHARRIVDALGAAETEVQAIAGMRAGVLRLGWFSTAGATLMPRAIARFRELYPALQLELVEGDPDECIERLLAGGLDLAIVYEFPHGQPLPPELRARRLLVDALHIALPAGHRLAARRSVTLADLAQESWIQGVRQGATVATLPDACRNAGFEPRIAFQTDDPMAWQGLVAAGVGVAVVPQLALPTARHDISIIELDAPDLVRQVSLAGPPGRYTPPATEAMARVLEQVAAELVGQTTGRAPASGRPAPPGPRRGRTATARGGRPRPRQRTTRQAER